MAPPVTLFPPPPSLQFAEDAKLKAAVKTAVDTLAAGRRIAPAFRLAIIDLGDGGASSTLKFGAHNGDIVDFIASEAKLIALYSAYALRDMVQRFAGNYLFRVLAGAVGGFLGSRQPRPPPDLVSALRAEMDPHILAAADGRLSGLDRAELVPDYKAMFELRPNGVPDFTAAFSSALQQMIVPSSNSGASQVIMTVGFAYISGAMKAAQLFVRGKGPWLSADFMGHYHPLIESENDNAVGQAGTALSMAKLMAIIVNHGVSILGDSFDGMEKLLKAAVKGIDIPLLTRDAPDFTDPSDADRSKPPLRIPRSKITHIKLGQDWLKPQNGKLTVWSEAWRIQGLFDAGKAYALSYQNLLTERTTPEEMAGVIRRAIAEYES